MLQHLKDHRHGFVLVTHRHGFVLGTHRHGSTPCPLSYLVAALDTVLSVALVLFTEVRSRLTTPPCNHSDCLAV